MDMTSRERFLTALDLKQPDRIPLFDFLFSQDVFQAVIGRRPESYNEEDAFECAVKIGHDAVWIPAGGFAGYSPNFIGDNSYIDEWGTTYKKDKSAWPIDAPISYPIESWEDLKNWKCPDPHDTNRMLPIKSALKRAQKKFAILGGVLGPFTTGFFLMGIEELSIQMIEDPMLVSEIFRQANEYNIAAGLHLIEEGVDAVIISDDLGYNNDLFVSPDKMRKYVLPYLYEMVSAFRNAGARVILHCDGNINKIIDDVAKCGINGYHPVERKSNMDLSKVKAQYGRCICPIGNVDSSTTLPFGSKEEIIEQTKECIRIAGPGGGYILASDHSLHDGIPVENIMTMIETAKKYGKYPLQL